MVVSWLSCTNYTNSFIYCYSQLTIIITWWYGERTKTQHCWQLAISATKVSGKKALNTKVKVEKGRAQEKNPSTVSWHWNQNLILFFWILREGEITISFMQDIPIFDYSYEEAIVKFLIFDQLKIALYLKWILM